jgi:serine phosphatase RsbU (regulator of sigma subunit)
MSLVAVKELQERVSVLELKSQEFEASMVYASRLQQAILPNEKLFQTAFSDAFVMYKPKDIISGDFYWIYSTPKRIYFAVGDCTGHGIPGAMLNIAGNTLLREIIKVNEITDPSEIIKKLDDGITTLFNENLTKGNTRDGMDIAFCSLDIDIGILSYCGAGRPLVLIRDNEVYEYKSGLNSVGYLENYQKQFSTIELKIEPKDQIYLFSDGYTDQFGGDNVKKFNRKRFRTLLLSISEMEMVRQRKELELAFDNWTGSQDQIDDVCVIGIRI